MSAASGMPKAYYDIYNNLKAKFEKTGKVAGRLYTKWDGPADQRAHMIALNYINKRGISKKNNQELIQSLGDYYKKTRELELERSFNHPDYKHIHGNDYDPEN